jgi:hypothetical protein
MAQMIVASITTSVDGYITGPNDGPEQGLGKGGERLHYWVFGGAWSYDREPTGEPTGADKEFLDEAIGREGDAFTFVDGLDEAVTRARGAAGGKDVSIMGGADVIRQALRAGLVDELSISIAPVVLGAGKRLFDGFDETIGLEHVRVRESPFATHITYRVVR